MMQTLTRDGHVNLEGTIGSEICQKHAQVPSALELRNTLPVLPGNEFRTLKHPSNYKKQQSFTYRNGVPQAFDLSNPAAELTRQAQRTDAVLIQQSQPGWQSLDNKVIRFFGYFVEGVHERREENKRARRCTIYYFLEDDTMQLIEGRQENSGLNQGNLVKRHRIPKKVGGDDYFSIGDFNLGSTIEVYGKVIKIVECDSFTRSFYLNLGRPLKPKINYPEDEESWKMQRGCTKKGGDVEWKRYNEYAVGGRMNLFTQEEREANRRFLHNDRQVLRFFAVWDDRQSMHGDYRFFTISYFLSDKTIKVTEVTSANSGRDPFPVFVKRSKIEKGNNNSGGATLTNMGAGKEDTVTDKDLMIGRTLEFSNRKFLIYDCDEFTRKYYKSAYGIVDFTPVDITLPSKQRTKPEAPPHTGFGSEEDSLSSWKHMVLKPPRRNMSKQIALDNQVLRFGAQLEADPNRRLIVCFYLGDDTLSLFEQSARNTGVVGGKFLQRQKVKKCQQQIEGEGRAVPDLAKNPEWFGPQDFYVGARICVNGHWVVLDETDQATVSLMEGKPKEFKVSNVNIIYHKIKDQLGNRYAKATEAFRSLDKDHNGLVTSEEFLQSCTDLNINLSQHELVTLMRHLDLNNDGVIDYKEFVEQMQQPDYVGQLDLGVNDRDVTRPADAKDLTFKRAEDRFGGNSGGTLVLKALRDRLESSRATDLDIFRMLSGRSMDCRLGVPEFRKCVEVDLQMNFREEQMEALCQMIFPTPTSRLTMFEFQRAMEAPHYFKKV